MRQVANLFISGFIIWGASKLLPERVFIKDFKTLIMVTILLWILTIIINVIGFLMMGGGLFLDGCGCSWLIAGSIIMAFSKIIALHTLNAYMVNFTITNFWLEVIIAILCSIFTISPPTRSNRYYDDRY